MRRKKQKHLNRFTTKLLGIITMATENSSAEDSAELPRTVVVLPAGGTGERLGDHIPKQFVNVCGKPLYLWTVAVFNNLPWIQEIYLVVNEQCFEKVDEDLKANSLDTKVVLVKGSSTRHRSIQAGVHAAYQRKMVTEAEVVIIHDVVRPIVSAELCENVAKNARKFGACGPVRSLVSTIVTMNSDGFMQDALPRASLRASEMPQAFLLEIINKSYNEISEEELDHGTECLLLARKYNNVTCHVKLLEWHEDLFKVTYKRDLLAVEALIKEKLANDVSKKY